MNIKTRVKDGQFVELHIESNNTNMTEDLSTLKDGKWIVPLSDIENFITIANDCSRFNGTPDVDFVKMIFHNFLSDNERSEFLEQVTPNNT